MDFIYNYYVAILILAIIFFLISNQNISILISIIIIIIIAYFYFPQINNYNNSIKTSFDNKIKILNNDIKDKSKYSHLNVNFFIKDFPTSLKYLPNDKFLIELLLNLRFIKVFDEGKFDNLINLFENFLKIYIFILGNRYDINTYFTTFIDLRTTIIKELYSIYIIIPLKLKFIYGINVYNTIKLSINDFISYSRKMIIILERFGYENKKIVYLPDTKFKPFQKNNIDVF